MLVGLFNRTSYTLGHSAIIVSDLIQQAKRLGYSHLALCDRHLIGLPSFANACLQNGITPIYGLEVLCNYDMDTIPFTLLAKDRQGYQQLLSLSSKLTYPNFFNKNARDAICQIEDIQACDHCHLIVYSHGGLFDYALESENTASVNNIIKDLQHHFHSFSIGISMAHDQGIARHNKKLKEIANIHHIPTLAFPNTIYLVKEEIDLIPVVNAMFVDTTLDSMFMVVDEGSWLLSKEELETYYDSEDIEETNRLASSIHVSLQKEDIHLPPYKEANNDPASYLRKLSKVGLEKRLASTQITDKAKYYQRLEEELDVICQMNFASYFLTVFDYVRFAKRSCIWVGPGRGSAVASLVAYAIGISDIDPLPYNLLFDRFLNRERKGMPDIDIDFEEERRQEVIQYVMDTYGKENVSGVITISKYKGKNLLKSVAKVMSLDNHPQYTKLYRAVSDLLKIRGNENLTLKDMRKAMQPFLITPTMQHFYSTCEKLTGIIAGYGRHNSGIIVADQTIANLSPVIPYNDAVSPVIQYTQYSEEYLESRGLIKMDFLSLPSAKALAMMIQYMREKDPNFNVKNISLTDPLLYKTFQLKLTGGYFQFDAQSMRKNILSKIQPKCFADLVACNALGRAQLGALVNDYSYLSQHPERIQYPSKELQEVLHETYGMMLYQEQVMLVAHVAADYTMSEADNLRRGIKKKDANLLRKYEDDFKSRCMKHKNHPYTLQDANYLWENILRFGNYGFNKSHSVAYSMIAVWQAYFKIYHTDIYYRMMDETSVSKGNEERFIQEKEMIERMKLERR